MIFLLTPPNSPFPESLIKYLKTTVSCSVQFFSAWSLSTFSPRTPFPSNLLARSTMMPQIGIQKLQILGFPRSNVKRFDQFFGDEEDSGDVHWD